MDVKKFATINQSRIIFHNGLVGAYIMMFLIYNSIYIYILFITEVCFSI